MKKTIKKDWIVTPGLIDPVRSFVNLHETLSSESQKVPIMICGPSGVGKSLFVHIYECLARGKNKEKSEKPFVRLNCAAFNKEILLSELFGHVKGAFTGAEKDKIGHIKKANNGVLVLEEIGELPEDGQAKLLTFIEDGYYFRVGSEAKEHADVQIVATTNKGKDDFREDFWYRFFPFYVPPLHVRRQDILYYLAEKFPDITTSLLPWQILTLLAYNWPGNIRELERVGRIIKWELLNQKQRPLFRFIKKYEGKSYPEMTDVFDFFYKQSGDGKSYSGIDPRKTFRLYRELKKCQVDVDYLNQLLGEGGLSLSSDNKKSPFPMINDFKGQHEEDIEGRFDVTAYLNEGEFGRTYEKFLFFCELILRSDKADDDLLDMARIEIYRNALSGPGGRSRLLGKSKETQLAKKIREVVLDIELPPVWEDLLSITKKEYAKLKADSNLTRNTDLIITKKTIANMKMDELDRLYLNVIMDKAGGNKAEAARLSGLKKGTFVGRANKLL